MDYINKIPMLVMLVIALCSFKADTTGPWIQTSRENITLFTRPIRYSTSNSPDSTAISQIILEQNRVIDSINIILNVKFDKKVEIFLFNQNEATTKLGTENGGFCDSRKNRIYFAFGTSLDQEKPVEKTFFVGMHEMAHIIAHNEIGWAKTRLMREGLANAIDGTYGKEAISKWMNGYIKNNLIVSPKELLADTDLPDRVFYPQSGYFTKWLIMKYGIEKIKEIYISNSREFVLHFEKITGDSFESMNEKYLHYCTTFN